MGPLQVEGCFQFPAASGILSRPGATGEHHRTPVGVPDREVVDAAAERQAHHGGARRIVEPHVLRDALGWSEGQRDPGALEQR